MPGKPRSQWSPAYAARVARAEAKGLTRQAARGHKAKEHVTRAEANKAKADLLGGLTARDRAYVRDKARKHAAEFGKDRAATEKRMLDYATRQGADRFRELMKMQQQARREYVHASKEGSFIPRGIEYWLQVADDYDLDADNVDWLFYMGAIA